MLELLCVLEKNKVRNRQKQALEGEKVPVAWSSRLFLRVISLRWHEETTEMTWWNNWDDSIKPLRWSRKKVFWQCQSTFFVGTRTTCFAYLVVRQWLKKNRARIAKSRATGRLLTRIVFSGPLFCQFSQQSPSASPLRWMMSLPMEKLAISY